MVMWPKRICPTQISHVSLRVTDLQRSAAFYCNLFGLEMRPANPPGDSACLCAAPAASSSFGIALVQGLPRGADPIGLDHVSLEVRSRDDVDDIYVTAAASRIHATEPREYGGAYQTFVFDPDGYKIEVVSRETQAGHEARSTARMRTSLDSNADGPLGASHTSARAAPGAHLASVAAIHPQGWTNT